MNDKINELIQKYYNGKKVMSRDKVLENEILSNISVNTKILDAGCGYNAEVISEYFNLVGESIGVDLVRKFVVNPKIKTITANLESLPFKDNYFDVIISRSVCEHLKDVSKVFGELKRVLKPGGKIIMITPNKYFYYSIISIFLPDFIKKYLLRKMYNEDPYDNFTTYYRCNTERAIKKIAKKNDLIIEKLLSIRLYPSYLKFSIFLFRIAILYDKFITAYNLKFLQGNILFVLKKK